MSLRPVSWTIAGTPVRMGPGWSATCNEGGHDQMRGTIPEADWRAVRGGAQGSVVRGMASDGLVVWEGRLSQPPQITAGLARLAAQGWKYKAVKKTDRLFVMSHDLSQWTNTDADPLSGGDAYRKMETNASGGGLRWRVNQGDALVAGANNRAGFAFWAEGIALKQISFTMNYDNNSVDNNLEIQHARVDGPGIGTPTVVNSYGTTAGNQNTSKTSTPASTNDCFLLYLRVTTNETPTSAQRYKLSDITVWSDVNAGLDSSWSMNDFTGYVATILGYERVQVGNSNVLSIGPFDWTGGSWLAAMLYVSEGADEMVRILEDRGSGPALEFGPWGNRVWTVSTAQGAAPDLTPLELFDKVRVFYRTPGGVERSVLATSTLISVDNTYEFWLEDAQTSATFPQAVADRLRDRLQQQRYAGPVSVAAAADRAGYDNPYAIRYGDVITVSDWGPGQDLTLRVMEVEYRQDGVTVTTEQPVNLRALVGRRRGRRNG